MYRSVLPLLLTAVLLLSGCTAGQKNMSQKTDEKEMTGQPSDMSGEGSMYMDISLGQFTRNYTQTTKRGLLTTNKG